MDTVQKKKKEKNLAGFDPFSLHKHQCCFDLELGAVVSRD